MNPTRRLLMTSALVALIAIFIRAGVATAQTNATLANRNSNPQTQALYRYLTDLYGTKIIAGQQESTWMGSENYEFDIICNASGKLPAIRGLDYMNDDFRGVNRRAQEWFKRGGIVTICWHCGADFRGSHRESLRSNLDWQNALSSGTPENKKLLEGMDKAARALAQLQDEGVTVLWRPFHEFDGGWFWWGKGSPEDFVQLWRMMYRRYTETFHLNNLIWVWTAQTGDDVWYPGDEFVDIVGRDNYAALQYPLMKEFKLLQKTYPNKMITLAECGSGDEVKMSLLSRIWEQGSRWSWFMTWYDYDYNHGNSEEHKFANEAWWQDAFAQPYVVSREQIKELLK